MVNARPSDTCHPSGNKEMKKGISENSIPFQWENNYFLFKHSGRFYHISLAMTVLNDILARRDIKGKFKG